MHREYCKNVLQIIIACAVNAQGHAKTNNKLKLKFKLI